MMDEKVLDTLRVIATHEHKHAQNRFTVIPTDRRLNANADYTGRGVAIAFLDSNFYPHPDLVEPINRIIAYKDITEQEEALRPDQPA